jgi:hypothetical protein
MRPAAELQRGDGAAFANCKAAACLERQISSMRNHVEISGLFTVRLPNIFARLSRFSAKAIGTREAYTSSNAPAAVASPPIQSAAQQWSRLAMVVKAAIVGAEEANRRQTAATQQLDLAQYALYTLGDELAAVMSIPGRREPASVHILDAKATGAKSQALAA